MTLFGYKIINKNYYDAEIVKWRARVEAVTGIMDGYYRENCELKKDIDTLQQKEHMEIARACAEVISTVFPLIKGEKI